MSEIAEGLLFIVEDRHRDGTIKRHVGSGPERDWKFYPSVGYEQRCIAVVPAEAAARESAKLAELVEELKAENERLESLFQTTRGVGVHHSWVAKAQEATAAIERAEAAEARVREVLHGTSPARHDFLRVRARYIRELVAEGESLDEIVRVFAMDPGQVQLIAMSPPDTLGGKS
jgi:hypothetical protein